MSMQVAPARHGIWLDPLPGFAWPARLGSLGSRLNKQFAQLDLEPTRDPDQRIDRHVSSPLLDSGIVGRQHAEPAREGFLGFAPVATQLLDSEPNCSQGSFGPGCHTGR